MEAKLEDAIPRNFNIDAEPLTLPKLSLKIKSDGNLVYRLFRMDEPFRGIYYAEKIRVLKVHQENKFKENLL